MLTTRSGLTDRGFLKRFRIATGLPPMEYVRIVRIEDAKHLDIAAVEYPLTVE